jgi:thiamine biosynthesis protein ThiI
MKEIILIKMGEIVLKGLNRKTFENALIKNIKYSVSKLGQFNLKNAQSTITLEPLDDNVNIDEVIIKVSKIFGIAAFNRACVVEKQISEIEKAAVEYLKDELTLAKTFKVEAKRSDKAFPMKSPEICNQVGGYILSNFNNLKVDVHNPEVTVIVEIRDFGAYIHTQAIKGAGGIPVGTGGKAAILMSGGIDSPVAAYMMAKRGVKLTAIHFESPPYTSERARKKVITLVDKLSSYCQNIKTIIVPFTKIQEEIKRSCPEDFFTIIMRRIMVIIAQRIAEKEGCQALVTGESLGQVASQTLSAICCVDEVSNMPILRPLIGMDKDEIVTISRKIDTFETSILPYEDCCTVFTPKHPRTRPVLKFIKLAHQKINFDDLIEEAIDNIQIGGNNYGR